MPHASSSSCSTTARCGSAVLACKCSSAAELVQVRMAVSEVALMLWLDGQHDEVAALLKQEQDRLSLCACAGDVCMWLLVSLPATPAALAAAAGSRALSGFYQT